MVKKYYTSWIALGIYRGIDFYNNSQKNNLNQIQQKYSYINCVKTGALFGLIYATPCAIFRIGPKEYERFSAYLNYDFGFIESSKYYIIW